MLVTSIITREDLGIFAESEAVELRIDLLSESYGLSETAGTKNETERILSATTGNDGRFTKPVIATCRIRENDIQSVATASEILEKCIKASCAWIDLETEWPHSERDMLIRKAHESGVKVIISYHNYSGSDSFETLKSIYDNARKCGADIVKTVITAKCTEDAVNLLRAYSFAEPGTLVAFAMGEAGRFSRLAALSKGSPFTYVSACGGRESAPGQYSMEEMRKLLSSENYPVRLGKHIYGNRRDILIPSSKSIAQRAVILAALSGKTTVLENMTLCNDISAAVSTAIKLGASVREGNEPSTIIIESSKNELCSGETPIEIDCGESGLMTRISLAIGAFLKRDVTICGHGSLLTRKFDSEIADLENAGIKTDSDNGRLPVKIKGCLSRKSHIKINATDSSQFVTGMMIASSKLAGCHLKPEIIGEASRMYIKITEECIRASENERIRIEGDWSSAAFHIVASAINSREITLHNLRTCSMQPDKAIIDIIRDCGADIITVKEPDGFETITVKRDPESELRPFIFDAADSPDLFPILSVLAMFCNGESRIKGWKRLLNKESNRLESICAELTVLGAGIWTEGEELAIRPPDKTGAHAQSGPALCRSHNDHRIAMSIAVAATALQREVFIDSMLPADKSYPGFCTDLYDNNI